MTMGFIQPTLSVLAPGANDGDNNGRGDDHGGEINREND